MVWFTSAEKSCDAMSWFPLIVRKPLFVPLVPPAESVAATGVAAACAFVVSVKVEVVSAVGNTFTPSVAPFTRPTP